MFKRNFVTATVIVAAFILGGILQPFHYLSISAQGTCQTYPETGKTVCGRFLTYWTTHGGLAQQGLPLTGEFVEVSDLNGQPYTVQYFERAVFEYHPEISDPKFQVLLSQLGTFQLKRKYPNGAPTSVPIQPTSVPVQPTATTRPPVPTQPPPGGGGACGTPYNPFGPDRDCGDFSSQSQAQCFFEAAGGPGSDRHGLDSDNDGIACESLP